MRRVVSFQHERLTCLRSPSVCIALIVHDCPHSELAEPAYTSFLVFCANTELDPWGLAWNPQRGCTSAAPRRRFCFCRPRGRKSPFSHSRRRRHLVQRRVLSSPHHADRSGGGVMRRARYTATAAAAAVRVVGTVRLEACSG